jgi:D-serine deaminase-like pyridoxal phosphate-dependent protein
MQISGSQPVRWFEVENAGETESPSLIVYPDRIESNIREMIVIAGDRERLRPHVKTHKMPEIIRLQIKYGIKKVKCATIAEAEMAAEAGADDILLAYQPVGPNVQRFFSLQKKFPRIKFSCIADCEDTLRELSVFAGDSGNRIPVWLDINAGMNRTGTDPGKGARELFRMITMLPGLIPAGLHVYDGHIHEKDLESRVKICDEAYTPVQSLIEELRNMTGAPVKIVAGGTPTFPIHAKRENVELSPGTTLLWDYGYGTSFGDLNFLHAAVLFTRVISKPSGNKICLDLGHKAVGSEMPQPRIKIIGMEDFRITAHNEEHMVIETDNAGKFSVGDHLYALPYHICPTVDRYDNVYVAENNRVTGQWSVRARKRKITV